MQPFEPRQASAAQDSRAEPHLKPSHRSPPERSPRTPRSLLGNVRGLSSVEYVVVLVLVVCVALVVWQAFGTSLRSAILGGSKEFDRLSSAQGDASSVTVAPGSGGPSNPGNAQGAGRSGPGSSPAEARPSPADQGFLGGVLAGIVPGAAGAPPPAASEVARAGGQAVAESSRTTTLLLTGADIATDLLPIVSNFKDGATAFTGINPVTRERVGALGRVAAGIFAIPGLGNTAKYAVKGLKYAFKGAKGAAKALEAARAGSKIVRAAGEGAVREAAELATKEGAEVAAREAAERTAREASERAAREASEQGAKQTSEQGAREASEQGSQGATAAVAGGPKPSGKPPPIGFAQGLGASAFPKERLQHASRHLTESGVLPNWSKATGEKFVEMGSRIVENPIATFNHTLKGGHATRGFLGKVDGKDVVVLVFKEGPNAGKVATSFVPTPAQLAQWGVP